MKNLSIIGAIIMVLALTTVVGCKKSINPVRDTKPVDTTVTQDLPMDQLHQLGDKGDTIGQKALVDKYRPIITRNIVRYRPDIKDEKKIHLILGSGFAKNVKSGDGKTYSGKFKNELIVIIDEPADTFFLACGNGLLSPLRLKNSIDLGNAEQWRFTIQEGEGLANHLPELEAWAEVANDLSIPIKDENGNVVSKEKYLNYLGSYTTGLRTGDVIDVINGKVYDNDGNEVDFNRRQQQTKRANELKNKRK